MTIQNVKGTHDIFIEEANAFSYVENVSKHIASIFNFKEVRPPVIEHSELFVRSVGESSDVVRKEMYTFLDKGNRSLTLRPEFTAGVVRLIIQNKMLFNYELPFKCFYHGPLFRYERPQLGRYRQFNQFGVESIGPNNPMTDIEVIVLAYSILQTLGLENVTIKINTLGDDTSRNNYKKALYDFFATKIDKMCPDCKSRLELNPLRILDCKVKEDQEIIKEAPKMNDFLSKEAKEKFEFILNTLSSLDIPYEVDTSLVRGLDYYSDTVFEFHYTSIKGNDYGAIGGGGHYDKLVTELGGPNYHGVGFSFGVERIVNVLKDDGLLPLDIEDKVDFYVMPLGQDAKIYATIAANSIRMMGYRTEFCFDDVKLNNMFKRAEKKKARFAVIVGEEEVKSKTIIIKDMETKEQIVVAQDELTSKVVDLMEDGDNNCCCHEHHHGHECHCHDYEGEDDCCHDSEHTCCCKKEGK